LFCYMKALGKTVRTDGHQAKILDSKSLSKWMLAITVTFGANILYAQVLLVTVTIFKTHKLNNIKDN